MLDSIWIVGIGVSLVAVGIHSSRARRHVQDSSAYKSTVVPYLRWATAVLCAPWLLMGVLLQSGAVSSVALFFGPTREDTWVILWYVALVVEMLGFCTWVVCLGGAELYARYPFLLNLPVARPLFVKLAVVGLFGVVWSGVICAKLLALVLSG